MTRKRLLLTWVVLAVVTASAVGADTAEEKLAEEILRSSGVKGGLCVHLGVTDGRLTAELAAGDRFLVHGLAADASTSERARVYLRSRGVYGKVSVERGSFRKLPYAEDLVNLLVVDDLPALLAKGLQAKEVLRVLVPGGVAVLGTPDRAKFPAAVLRAWLAASGVVNPELIGLDGVWARVVKPRPKGLDEWTHWRHGVDGNIVSNDTVVDLPRRLQWMADPTWARSHVVQSGPRAMVSSGGRLFCIYDAAPRGLAGPMQLKLTARDAFNGLLLWEHEVKSSPDFDFLRTEGQYSSYYWYQRRCLAAVNDRVYAVLEQNGPLLALDAATGQVVKTYDQVGSPNEVLYHDGRLVLVIHPPESGRWGPRTVCCLDPETGKVLWVKDKDRARYVTIGEGSVFYDAGKEIVRVDLAGGEEQWRAAKPEGAEILCLYQEGRLFLRGNTGNLCAVSAADGAHLWTYPYQALIGRWYSDTEVFHVGGLVWVEVRGERWAMVGLDPAAGTEARRVDFPETYPKTRGHHRCHPNKATTRYFLLDTNGIDFIDWQTPKIYDVRPIRGSCYYGILPANGLVYVPPNACQCGEYLRGFVAFSPSKVTTPEAGASVRFERGPAFGKTPVGSDTADPDAWPMHRHDPQRSGSTSAVVSAELKPLWERKIGGRLTAPTVAGGTVFLARPDTHEVCAFDAVTGEPRWRHTTDGRVDSPPTIHGGLVLFGCRNGWVTCLRAGDGEMVWRFRAAPGERRISAFGQLESPWPVNGSVLVHQGTAFFSAGHFSELDGGITVYAADPASGKILWEKKPAGIMDEIMAGKVWETSYPPVALNDVLTASGEFVSMRSLGFDVKTGEMTPSRYGLWTRSGMLDPGSWAGRMRWRGPSLHAELLVFNRRQTCGFIIKPSTEWPAIPGKGEYALFARPSWKETTWTSPVSLRARAMVLAADTLFVAGVPDVVDEKEYWARIEGLKGTELWVVSAVDGKKLHVLQLDAVPVFDGMAAAGGRLYLTTTDGRLLCFGQE